MTEDGIKLNWYYFCALAKQLHSTEQYVDHSVDEMGSIINGSAFSNEFVKILLLASSEFEVICKALCTSLGVSLPWNASIDRISREILSAFPRIGETIIETPYQSIRPLKDWEVIKKVSKNGKVEYKVVGIPWWSAHNEVKHNRGEFFRSANLQNCVYAMSSLMVLELYLSKKTIGNLDVITTIRCDYFDCEYGLAYLVNNTPHSLPDNF